MIRICFVCMGNICRSPTAEGVFRRKLQQHGLADRVEVASAGTHAYHVGEAPDPRAQSAAARRGYDLSKIRARKIAVQDVDYFDLILAMDRDNLSVLERVFPQARHDRLGLVMNYASASGEVDVPDPYYGAGQGFDRVLDLIEDATDGLIVWLKQGGREKQRPVG